MSETIVYLVRHGEAEGNISRHFHGHTDSALTPNGKKQVERAAQRLAEEPIDVIYSSDLRRAYETAKAAADLLGLSVHTTPALREINGGEWEGQRWEDLPKRYPDLYPLWEFEPHRLKLPGGESMEEFHDRLIGCITEIVRKNEGRHILVASHGTAIRTILCHYKGWPPSRLPEAGWQDNTAISVIAFDSPEHGVVTLEGDSRHLGELSTLRRQDWWKKKGIYVNIPEENPGETPEG